MQRRVRTTRRPMNPFMVGFIALALASVCVVASLAGLWALGVELPFLFPRKISRDGMVGVPVANQPIPAFTSINRNYLIDPKTDNFLMLWFTKDQYAAVPHVIRDPAQLLNRVLSHDKQPGMVFTESDFLPLGTRPGLTGGTPTGKRALTLGVEHLTGAFGLRIGDRVDLMATVPIDSTAINQVNSPQAKGLAAQAQVAKILKRASVRILAQDAIVVMPVTSREKPITSSTLLEGTQTRTVPVQEIVIAVNPDEAAAISEAEAMHLKISCVIRSGRPNDPDVATPGADPLADTSIIMLDTILGSKRDTQVFPNSAVRLRPPVKPSRHDEGAELPPVSSPAPRNGLGTGLTPSASSRGPVSTLP